MKSYQKDRLSHLLELFSVKSGTSLLIVTLPQHAAPAQRESEVEFLSEARSLFSEKKITVETYPIDKLQSMWDDRMYDTIILRYVLYYRRGKPMDERKSLGLLARHLNADGTIYILENNRMGVRTLAGDRFDGLDKDKGLIRQELIRAFEYAGLFPMVYYPHPFAEELSFLFSDERLPQKERLLVSVREGTGRVAFFDEASVMSSAVREGLFPSMANQFFCVLKKHQDDKSVLVYRRYDIRRDKKFATITDVMQAKDGTRTLIRRAASPSSAAHVLRVYDNYQRLSELYKGYTLQIAPSVCDMDRVAMRLSDRTTLEELLDETIDRQANEEFFGLIQRTYDILTSPTRILTDDGRRKQREAFSEDAGFVRAFGSFYGREEELFLDDRVLPLSPINGSFSDYTVEGTRWTLNEYEWVVDFPVPFSYVLFRMLHRFFLEEPRRNLDGALMTDTFRRFGISEEMERALIRMEGHFAGYVTGRAMTVEKVLDTAKKHGDFLPAGELIADFLDGNGQLSARQEEEYDAVGKDFKSRFIGRLRQLLSFGNSDEESDEVTDEPEGSSI